MMNNTTPELPQQYTIYVTTTYKKEYKKFSNQEAKKNAIKEILKILMFSGAAGIPQKHVPHVLIGSYKGYWECHVQPDLLLIWEQNEAEKTIILQRVGSHSELFGKNKK